MEKIKSKHQIETETRNTEIKRLWKSLWYRGALRTVIAEAVADMYTKPDGGKLSYSTILRIIGRK